MRRALLSFSISLVFIILTASNSNAQSFEWGKTIGGNDIERSNDLVTDQAGNVYIAGTFTGAVDVDPGSGVSQLYSGPFNTSAAFIEKLDAQGNFQWAVSFADTVNINARVYISSIEVDQTGNLYCTGNFRDAVDFDPGPSSTVLVSSGEADVFILKLDNSGHFLWVRSIGGEDVTDSYSIELDSLKNIYIGGNFRDSCDFDPGMSTYILNKVGDTAIASNPFILKLDSNANFLWVKTWHGNSTVYPSDIDVDQLGNVYATGWFGFDSVDFDPGNGIFYINAPYSVLYIQKLDPLGNFVWAKAIQGTNSGSAIPKNIIAYESSDIYITGIFRDTIDVDPGTGVFNLASMGNTSADIFVLNINSSGTLNWGRSFGGPDQDYCQATYVDSLGSVYTTGYFRGTSDLDPGLGINRHSAVDLTDCYIQKMNKNGGFEWAVSYGGSSHDIGYAISVDKLGNVYTCGEFDVNIDLDPGQVNSTRAALGGSDIFIQKLNQTITGFNDFIRIDEGLLIYPNPSKDHINLQLNEPITAVTLSLTDLSGKVVYRKYFEKLNEAQIELPDVEGIYLLNLESSAMSRVFKVVKQ